MTRHWIGLAAALLLGGCGDEAAPARDAAVADLAGSDGGCADPTDTFPDGGACLVRANGQVVDEHGAPLPGLVVSVCADACYLGKTGSDGKFDIAVGTHLVLADYALHVDGRPDRASYYMALPALDGATVRFAAPLPLPLLPASGPAIALDKSAQTVTSGDVTLTIAAGTKVLLDVEDVEAKAAGQQFRALKAGAVPFSTGDNGAADVLYAFQPFEVNFSQKATLSFANSAQWPAGAAVDVLAMRGLVGATPPAGPFQHVATAHVSSDASRIDFDAGEGVVALTWIALKKK